MKLTIEEYIENKEQNEKEKLKQKLIIAKECLIIAQEANFPTDFKDVYDHLFEDESYIRIFIKDDNNIIKGFMIACNEIGYDECKILHIHGIVLGPDIQGLGMSKQIINYAVEKYAPDVVTAKTHNPRCFNAFINIAGGGHEYYPSTGEIPEYIREVVKTDKFIYNVDENMIYKNAYPDEKIQQSKRNNQVDEIFSKVGSRDAQALLVVINDEKIRKGKMKKKVR